MTSQAFPLPHEDIRPNPAYGSGFGRRKILLVSEGDQVFVHLIDVIHHLRCTITHDGVAITAVTGEMLRYPTNMCPGAPGMLGKMIGTRLDATGAVLSPGAFSVQQCTHLKDMALLAMRHALRDERVRMYEAIVEDEAVGGQGALAEVFCNDRSVLRWRIVDDTLIEPAAFAGRPLSRGFFRWAPEALAPDDLEAAGILAKTLFISASRRWTAQSLTDFPLADMPIMKDACFAAAPDRIAGARYLGTNQVGPDDSLFDMTKELTRHGLLPEQGSRSDRTDGKATHERP